MISTFPQIAVDNFAKLWRNRQEEVFPGDEFQIIHSGGTQSVKTLAVGREQNNGLLAMNTGLGTVAGPLDDGATLSLSWTPAPLEPLPWLLLLQNLLKEASPTAFPLLPCTDSNRFPIPGCALAGHRNQWIA